MKEDDCCGSLLYRLQQIEGKGCGLVAARDIQPSELIVEETPLLTVPLDEDGNLPGQFNGHRLEYVSPPLILALNQLPDNDLIKFYSLTDSCSANLSLIHI